MKRLYNRWRRALVRSERTAFSRLLATVDRSIAVLEAGCGRGGKLAWLKQAGFTDLAGVDVDPHSVALARQAGFTAMTVDELENTAPGRKYGMLVLAHVIEHFGPADLLRFMDGWLDHLAPGGLLLAASPLPHPAFFLDFDHIKPYYPQGIMDFFGPHAAQTQARSRHVLELEDIRFKRGPFRIRMARSLLLKRDDAPLHLLNLAMLLAYAATAGLAGRNEGWVGLFRYRGLREASAV